MRYEVTAPDGRRFEVTAPEGTSPDVLAREVEAAFQSMPPTPRPPASEGMPAPRQAPTGRGEGFLPFINRGIAGFAGAPIDFANTVLRATGLPVSERPFGGSASIESGLARFGRAVDVPMVPGEDMVAETLPEYVGQGIGQAAAALNPTVVAARLAAAAANPIIAGIGQTIARAPLGTTSSRVSRYGAPAATIGVETASGAGGGAGRYVGEVSFPDVEGAGALGEVLGGLGVGAVAATPSLLTQTPAGRATAAAITPFTPTGSRTRAANRLVALAEDPAAASRAAEAPAISELTPAQRTGEPRLLALERAVAEKNPAIARDLRERAARSQQTLEEEARALGGRPEDTRAFLEDRVTRLSTALNTRVEQAQTEARRRIAALEPGSSAADASRIAREEFDKAYDDAFTQMRALYQAVPADVQIDTAPLFQRFAALIDETPVTGQQNIPAYVRKFLDADSPDRLGPTVRPDVLLEMRASLTPMISAAREQNDLSQLRILKRISDDVVAAIDSVPETGGPYDVARNFSRRMDEKFRGSAAGALSERTGRGAPEVAPELTLETLLGRGGPRADIAARDLLVATDNSPATRAAIENYLTQSFRNTAISGEGRLKPESVTNWMRTNAALLERFPEVRNQLAEAVSAQGRAQTLTARQTAVERGLLRRDDTRMARLLDQRQESATARFLNAAPGTEVGRVFAADDPAALAASLRRSVDRDQTGQALSGLRGAFIDNLFARARQTTPDGPVFNGSAITDALDDPKQAAALGKVFDASSLQRLRQISTELTALERTRGDLPGVGGVISDVPANILSFAGRIVAAQSAARVARATGAVGTIQAPGLASSAMQKFLTFLTRDRAEKLLTEAVTDPGLFAVLMSPMRTAREQDVAARGLRRWMVGPAGRALFGEDVNELEETPPNAMAPAGATGNVNAMSR